MSRIYHVEDTPVRRTMLLEASAGTGKTYALERMVAALVGREKAPLKIGEILVVTFTKRAAREMRERIRGLLSLRVNEESRSDAERGRFRMALSEFDRAPIYTIHGFCQMVLSTWPFESGAPFRQELEPGGILEREEVRRWLSSPLPATIDRNLFRAAYNQAGGGEALVETLSKKLLDSSVPHGSVLLPDDVELSGMRTLIDETNCGRGSLVDALAALADADWSDESIGGLLKGSGVYSRTKDTSARESIRAHVACLGGLGNRVAAVAADSAAGDSNPDFPALIDAIFGDPENLGLNNHFLNMVYVAVIWCSGEAGSGGNLSDASDRIARLLYDLYLALQPIAELLPAKRTVINHFERYMECEFDDTALGQIRERLEKRKDESGRWGYDDLIVRVARKITDDNAGDREELSGLLRKRYIRRH